MTPPERMLWIEALGAHDLQFGHRIQKARVLGWSPRRLTSPPRP